MDTRYKRYSTVHRIRILRNSDVAVVPHRSIMPVPCRIHTILSASCPSSPDLLPVPIILLLPIDPHRQCQCVCRESKNGLGAVSRVRLLCGTEPGKTGTLQCSVLPNSKIPNGGPRAPPPLPFLKKAWHGRHKKPQCCAHGWIMRRRFAQEGFAELTCRFCARCFRGSETDNGLTRVGVVFCILCLGGGGGNSGAKVGGKEADVRWMDVSASIIQPSIQLTSLTYPKRNKKAVPNCWIENQKYSLTNTPACSQKSHALHSIGRNQHAI
jgi:hypothetical protein